MPQTILLTAAKEDSDEILGLLDDENVLHTPLEVYFPKIEDNSILNTLNSLGDFENIVHSNKRNAQFFLEQVNKYDKTEAVKNRLNLTLNIQTFSFLEDYGVPAIYPQNGDKPIDLVELMLRLQRLGPTLYPCGAHQREDFPGFLKELDIAVTELDVFELEGPDKTTLAVYQDEVKQKQPDAFIFHSRRSVNRTMAAFPDLDYQTATIISADSAISNKLENRDITVDAQAEGSWESVAELL